MQESERECKGVLVFTNFTKRGRSQQISDASTNAPNVILNCSCNPKMLVCIFLFYVCMHAFVAYVYVVYLL